MSIRQDFINAYAFQWGCTTEYAEGLMEHLEGEHASALAERIRNSEELRDLTDDHMGDCNAAANLIDPEVEL